MNIVVNDLPFEISKRYKGNNYSLRRFIPDSSPPVDKYIWTIESRFDTPFYKAITFSFPAGEIPPDDYEKAIIPLRESAARFLNNPYSNEQES